MLPRALAAVCFAGLTAVAPVTAWPQCCADLDARIAELEATVARSGDDILEVWLEGTAIPAILYWDDGQSSDAYVVTNDNYGNSVQISGDVYGIDDSDWSSGFVLNIDLSLSPSSLVDQIDESGSQLPSLNESYLYIYNDNMGQVSLGLIGGSYEIDDASEMDLSDTRMIAYVGVEDVGGSFFLRRSGTGGEDTLTPVVWSDLIDHLPGVFGNLVRYDTPTFHGITGWVEGGQGPLWEAVLTYGDPDTLEDFEDLDEPPEPPLIDGFEIAAAIGVQGLSGDEFLPDNRALSASISALHLSSGFSITLAGGKRFFTESVELNDGSLGKPQDAFFYYVKPSLSLELVELGYTAFYGEHGRWHDFLSRNADAEVVAGLARLSEQDICLPGRACLVSNSSATVWGFGAVQHIDSAEMDFYVGVRFHQAEINLIDNRGAKVPFSALSDFVTIMSGAVIEF